MSYKGSEWKVKKEWKRYSVKTEKKTFDSFKDLADLEGLSINAYVNRLIKREIKK